MSNEQIQVDVYHLISLTNDVELGLKPISLSLLSRESRDNISMVWCRTYFLVGGRVLLRETVKMKMEAHVFNIHVGSQQCHSIKVMHHWLGTRLFSPSSLNSCWWTGLAPKRRAELGVSAGSWQLPPSAWITIARMSHGPSSRAMINGLHCLQDTNKKDSREKSMPVIASTLWLQTSEIYFSVRHRPLCQ